MSVYETFSRRRDAALKAGQAEVFVYDTLPEKLLNQIVLIWGDALSIDDHYWFQTEYLDGTFLWKGIEAMFLREHGMLTLRGQSRADTASQCKAFLRDSATSMDERLDLIEMAFSVISRTENGFKYIKELNQRFKLASVGYQFEGRMLIRVDSTYAHEEVVKPALLLLTGKGYEEANEQFRSAHDHYRKTQYPQTITQAARSFESTLKAVCAAKNWDYEKGARASDLIKVVVKHRLFPEWLGNGLTAYVAMLKTGLPEVRNEGGSHGTAPNAEPVHEYLARYALHMAASNILLIGEAAKKT